MLFSSPLMAWNGRFVNLVNFSHSLCVCVLYETRSVYEN